jgi:spore coat polysaccharide biosynthesis protein SpsF
MKLKGYSLKIVATVEARMGSSRLPGKVLKPLGGKPVLERLIERVSKSRYLDEIIVATTTEKNDNAIADLCNLLGVKCYRGSENDVLGRVLKAAKSIDGDIICELMGDSPLIDPLVIDQSIVAHLSGNYDYTSNFFPENTFPMGFAVQVFPVDILQRVAEITQDPIDRVHVSCFIYQNPKLFKLQGVAALPQLAATDIRLSLDTKDDYKLICRVFEDLHKNNPDFLLKDIVQHLRKNPELLLINAHVIQKNIDEG